MNYLSNKFTRIVSKYKNLEKTKNEEKHQCQICFESDLFVALVPCGHIITCEKCAKCLMGKNCPICRKEIYSYLKVYF